MKKNTRTPTPLIFGRWQFSKDTLKKALGITLFKMSRWQAMVTLWQ